MSSEARTSELRCADCGQPAPGNYCGACGQETRIETPTVRHFLAEFIDQYVALEGKLGRTLRTLILRPGRLTVDYLHGRRQRYVRPLKLYLTISVIFFALLGVLPEAGNPFVEANVKAEADGKDRALVLKLGSDDDATDEPDAKTVPAEAKTAADLAKPGGKSAAEPAAKSERNKEPRSALEQRIEDRAIAFSKLDHQEQNRLLRKKLADDAPYAMFFLLPYFALLLKWFYRREQPYYGAHLLFSLHLHCFVFIVLAFGFLPLPAVLRSALKLAVLVYLYLALREAYGSSPKRTIWRMAWLCAFYLVAVGASAASGVITALFDAGAAA